MIPIVSRDRLQAVGGLWTTKSKGTFVEGNPTLTSFYIEGSVEIKALGGHLKAYFKSIKLTPRTLEANDGNESDNDSDDSDEPEGKSKPESKPGVLAAGEEVKVPKLHVFLTTKKPKKRMVDAHKTGTKIKIPQLPEGQFGSLNEEQDYEAVLVDIADILSFQGVVIVKLPSEEPATEEPIVYGYVRLLTSRSVRVRSIDALHLSEMADMYAKMVLKEEMAGKVEALGPEAKRFLKPLHVYRSIAGKAWSAVGKGPEDTVDFEELMKLLDHLDLFFISHQAQRIFDAVDVHRSGKLGLSELENFLIAKDLLANFNRDLVVMDVYDALKAPPMSLDEVRPPAETTTAAEASPGKNRPASASNHNAKPTTTTATAKPRGNSANKNSKPKVMGMSYSAFIEAVQILGILDGTPQELQAAFCFGGDIKAKDANTKLLTLGEFRKAWLRMADVEIEMEERNITAETGMFSDGRNRERLSRHIIEREELYLKSLQAVNGFVETLKADNRRKKDEARRNKAAEREKLLHAANKFIAERAQEKRLLLKKEQEDKVKKRLEDKVLRNKLLLRQQEHDSLKRAEIAQHNAEHERLRLAEIRALGWDKIDLSAQELRRLPLTLYKGKEAQTRLSYLVYIDWSHNKIEDIPADLVLYNLQDARKLKLSQNRLKSLPPDLGFMSRLEILDLDANRLETLPESLGDLSRLQRLNLANNALVSLPESLGRCAALKYLAVHCNQLSTLPASLGGCYQLEFLDASVNTLHELPEDLQHCASLTHLDLHSNRLGHLPHNLGQCLQLQYLDISHNILAAIPRSFGLLSKLEFCSLEDNSIITAAHCLTNLANLKSLNLRKNQLAELAADLGGLRQLTALDLSLNQLTTLPLEIGLLTTLHDLKLAHNSLTQLPPELGSCISLQRLDLSHNAITGMLPEQLSLIRSLKDLDVSFNEIDSLPESFVGFQQLLRLNAERCRLSSLPVSFIHLAAIEELSLANNCFTRFPIELHHLRKTLRQLNMYNNALSLLPRSIASMQFLDVFNLARNQLQALPVEFVEILESVSTVDLRENPWGLLPPKWGHRRPNKECSDAPWGYALPDALDFLYSMRIIYDTVEAIWKEYGVFYTTHRLSLQDFVQEIRRRLPRTWHDGLMNFAEHLFFQSKYQGDFVRWYEVPPVLIQDAKQRLAASEAHRDANIHRAHVDAALRKAQGHQTYHEDIFRRMRQAADQIVEHSRGEELMETLQAQALHDTLRHRTKRSHIRQDRRQHAQQEQHHQETNRLRDILREDRPNRDAERAFLKSLRMDLSERKQALADASPVQRR